MVDFHSHILPNMDDGSKSIDMSLQMLLEEKKQGITDVILTPHYYPEIESISQFLSRRNNSLKLLLSKIKGKDLPRLYLGAEVAYYYGISSNKELDKLCLDGTRVILIEMPFSRWNDFDIEELLQLNNGHGFQVVLAHIERYLSFVPKKTLNKLYDEGIMLQVNAEFFIDIKTRRRAIKLFDNNLIDFIGADSHNTDSRPPNIGQAIDIIKAALGEDKIEEFIDYSSEIIDLAIEAL